MASSESIVVARMLSRSDEALQLVDRLSRVRPKDVGASLVFAATRTVAEKSIAPDIGVLEAVLKPLKGMDQQKKNGLAFLIKAAALSEPSPDEVELAVRSLLDTQKKVALRSSCDRLSKLMEEGETDLAEQVLIKAAAEMAEFDPEYRTSTFDAKTYEYWKQKPEEGTRVPTEMPKLDRYLKGGGLRRQLWLIAAWTGEGKTSFVRLLCYNAIRRGQNVVLVSLEDDRDETMSAFYTLHTRKLLPTNDKRPAGLTYDAVLTRGEGLDPKKKDILKATIDDWEEGLGDRYGTMTIVDPRDNADILTVQNELLQIRRRTGPIDLAVVDYLQYLEPLDYREKSNTQMARTMKAGRNISLRLNGGEGVFLVSPHPVKQASKEAADKKLYYPSRSLRESAEAGEKATQVIWLLIPDELRDQNKMRIGLAKNRGGNPGPFSGWWAVPQLDRCYIGEEDERSDANTPGVSKKIQQELAGGG